MKDTYKLNVAGCERELEIFPIGEHTAIAAFIMFGDVELTQNCAKELLKKSPEFDVIVSAECKSIPLCYEMARQSGKGYIIFRKSKKVYLDSSIEVDVKSITTTESQKLYIAQKDINAMKGKRVLIVDDVISTGGTIEVLRSLVAKVEGNIVGTVAVLAEGEAKNRDDIIFLEALPILTI